jgi:hypothetical protein
MTNGLTSPSHCLMRSQDFLLGATASAQGTALSFVDYVRYTYARTALPIPTSSSARRISLGRMGDDL